MGKIPCGKARFSNLYEHDFSGVLSEPFRCHNPIIPTPKGPLRWYKANGLLRSWEENGVCGGAIEIVHGGNRPGMGDPWNSMGALGYVRCDKVPSPGPSFWGDMCELCHAIFFGFAQEKKPCELYNNGLFLEQTLPLPPL